MTGSDRPVFIVGCARSGTTLLQLMVQAHPRLAMPPENRFVIPVYERRVKFGDPATDEAREAIASFIVDRKKSRFHDLGVDPEQARQRIREAPPTIGSYLGVVLEEYAKRYDRPRWGDKRPNYVQYLDRILALFPDAQILHIIRDGRACVASLKRMPWWDHGVIPAIYKWAEATHTADWAKAELPTDQYHEFRYEDLVSDPQPVLEGICDFLDEDFHPAMLEPHKVADDAVPDYKAWHEQTHKPVSASQVRSWETGLERNEIRLMEHVAGAELEAYGYELSTSRLRRRPPAKDLKAYLAFLERRRDKERKQRRAELQRQADYPWPVAAQLTEQQRRLASDPSASAPQQPGR
ncbi:MAG: sulfotransferase family protein [Nitriliruptoraceae bacterium]